MRWWLALVLSLVSCAVLAAEESRELIIGGRTALGTLRLPALLGPDVPLVLITHGTLAHKDMETIQGLSKALSERGIATLAHNLVLGLDRRSGMYDCGRPHDYAPDDAIPEIAAWLSEARKTSSRVFVLGHSRGANQVARYLAANSKAAVAGAILLAPATAGTEASLRAAYAETYGQSLTALLDKAEAALAAGRGGEWMSVPGFIYCRDAEVTARAFAAFYRADRRQDTASLIADVSLPILVLAAAQDKTVLDVAASFAPLASSAGGRVRLETIDDADHFFRDLAAEDAADRIAAFIAAVRQESPMERRSLMQAGLASLFGLFGVGSARAATESARQRVVYHLADQDRALFVLGNIQNHVDGTGGPGRADIRLVIHGPGLRAFHAISADQTISALAERLMKAGVGFDACANTMKAQGVKLDDLLPGFAVAEKGGVVRLTELQQSGYAYLRP